jgi:Zn-dependent peptidase ImmA (M78 family)
VSAPIFTSVSALLEDLGITEPDELDLAVIAQYCGATVFYKPLEGCAARIAGTDERAIITVDSNSRIERQRFSVGHELGHWMFDRGKMSLLACEESVFVKEWSKQNPEMRANRYASDLLMPIGMFKPRAASLKHIDFEAVKALAKIFQTSLSATAIRLVEHGPLPAILVCSRRDAIEWMMKTKDIKLFVRQPGPYSYAFDLLNGSSQEGSGDVPASAWFDHPIAGSYTVHEHSIRGFQDLVLSLLWCRDETMLIDLDEYEERKDARRSDWRD